MSKQLRFSKMFWLGVLYVVFNVAALVGFAEFEPGTELLEITGLVVGFVTILLRKLTNKPIIGL